MDYPKHAYKSKKEWLRDVRKRWVAFRQAMSNSKPEGGVRAGSMYYPDEVYEWISQFEEMDNKMKEYYKNA